MALFRFGPAIGPALTIRGAGLFLRPALMEDHDAWAALRETSRAHLTPWEPVWPIDDLTRAAFRRRLKRYAEEMARDESYPLLIFREGDEALLGGLTIGNVRRGVAQTATFGYWMGAPHAGRGYMTRAVAAACAFCFENLRLHRIEAACIHANAPSRRLLEKNGFRQEGEARAYLKINGLWQDHVLYARLESDQPQVRW
jgi:ribosomal-protein-alanine N-acetyltransferase